MGFSHVVRFAASAMLIIPVPGPSVLFVVGRSLSFGRRAALVTVAGNAAGLLVIASLVAVGLGGAIGANEALHTVIRLAGAAYLIHLGVRAWRSRHRQARATAEASGAALPLGRQARQGFVVGISNPKTAVFFAATLPQFVQPDAGSATVQMAVFGVIFAVLAMACDSVWAVAAGTVRHRLADRPDRLAVIGGAGGLALVALGLLLAAG